MTATLKFSGGALSIYEPQAYIDASSRGVSVRIPRRMPRLRARPRSIERTGDVRSRHAARHNARLRAQWSSKYESTAAYDGIILWRYSPDLAWATGNREQR